jgi:hypothetical protein
MTECLEQMGAAAGQAGSPERAARLFGAAHRLRRDLAVPLPPRLSARNERFLAAAFTLLPEEAWTACWEEGRSMDLDQAVSYALNPAVSRKGK